MIDNIQKKFYIINKSLDTQNVILINDKFKIKDLKENNNPHEFYIDVDYFNISKSIFGKSKKESYFIQKSNYRKVIKVYKKLVKIIKYLDKNNISFNNTFYFDSKEIKNNNHKMLEYLLILRFNKFKNKIETQIDFACDYLDSEIALNKVCDFKNGKCVKYTNKKEDNKSSCCKANCRYGVPCKIKNIACKLFMCDFNTSIGHCFFIKYIPLLKIGMSPIDRTICKNSLFMPMKTVIRLINISRIIILSALLIILSILIIELI